MSWRPCCCQGTCDVCDGPTPSLQATITGFSQVATPPLAEDPPCACTSLNFTTALESYAFLGDSECGDPIDIDGDYCLFRALGDDCTDGILGTQIAVTLDVTLYQNSSGGVSAFVQLVVRETNPVDGQYNERYYEGRQEVEAATTTIDCEALSTTVDLDEVCDTSGGIPPYQETPVWCGGTISVLVEAV